MLTYDIESKQWCNEAAPEMSIDEAKNFMIGLFDTHGSKMRDKITYPTSPSEMSSWPIKINEAAKFMSSLNPGDAPILSIEASTRGGQLDGRSYFRFHDGFRSIHLFCCLHLQLHLI